MLPLFKTNNQIKQKQIILLQQGFCCREMEDYGSTRLNDKLVLTWSKNNLFWIKFLLSIEGFRLFYFNTNRPKGMHKKCKFQQFLYWSSNYLLVWDAPILIKYPNITLVHNNFFKTRLLICFKSSFVLLTK